MKGKSLIIIAVLLTAATLIFTACNKKNEGTGLHVYVTDSNGNTVLDANGQPKTEEWKTSIVYATNAEGETYTNANGEKVTVKQTRPVLTSIVEMSERTKNADGEMVWVPKTTVIYNDVTDSSGNKVTQTVTDNDGNPVTEEHGEVVTEVVTESRTEKVTGSVQITVDGQATMYNNTIANKPVTQKTTSIYDNPLYTDKETKKTTKPAQTAPQAEKHVAANAWLKPVDASQNDTVIKTQAIDSKTYIIMGYTESTDGYFSTFSQTGLYSFVSKYDTDGKLIWTCPVGSAKGGHTKLHDIAVLNDGSFIAVGESNADDFGYTPDSTFEAIIVKISSAGKVEWIKNYGGTGTDYFKCVTATPDGAFVAAGRFSSRDGDFSSLQINSLTPIFVKFDKSGTVQWYRAFEGSSADAVNAIAADANGNIYGACQIMSSDGDGKGNHGSSDIGIIKFSSTGSKLWVRMIGGSKSDVVNDIYAGASGCIFAGSYASKDGDFTLNRGGKDAFIGFCDTEGNVKWLRTFGGLKNDTFNAIAPTAFGYATVGVSNSTNRDLESIGNKGESDGFVMSINSAGNLEHVKSLGGTDNDTANDICRLDSKTYIVTGETYSKDKDFSTFSTKGCSGVFGKFYIY